VSVCNYHLYSRFVYVNCYFVCIGDDFMTRILVSIGVLLFDWFVLKKYFTHWVQYGYPLLLIVGCIMYGLAVNTREEQSSVLGIIYGVLERFSTFLFMIWLAFAYDKEKTKGIDNMSMLFIQSYLGVIITMVVMGATGQFGVLWQLFSDKHGIEVSFGYMALQLLSSLIFFETMAVFHNGQILAVASDLSRGFVVIVGSFLFPPLPNALGWSGISMSVLGSFAYSVPPFVYPKKKKENQVLPGDEEEEDDDDAELGKQLNEKENNKSDKSASSSKKQKYFFADDLKQETPQLFSASDTDVKNEAKKIKSDTHNSGHNLRNDLEDVSDQLIELSPRVKLEY
jgi:gas vesicle protein